MNFGNEISPDSLVAVLSKLAQDNNLKVTVHQSLRGGLIAGSAAALGGLVAGRYGVAFGAVLGGALGAYTSEEFRPVHAILDDLSTVEKQRLYQSVVSVIGDVNMLDLAGLAVLIATDQGMKRQVIGAIGKFIHEEFKMNILE